MLDRLLLADRASIAARGVFGVSQSSISEKLSQRFQSVAFDVCEHRLNHAVEHFSFSFWKRANAKRERLKLGYSRIWVHLLIRRRSQEDDLLNQQSCQRLHRFTTLTPMFVMPSRSNMRVARAASEAVGTSHNPRYPPAPRASDWRSAWLCDYAKVVTASFLSRSTPAASSNPSNRTPFSSGA